MAHVFGFGTIWDEKNLLVGACPTSSTPSFVGQSSQEGFVAALVPGGVYNNPITPVEGEGTCNDGTRDGHWSESVMGNELMTGFLNGGSNPAERHHQRVTAGPGLRRERRAERSRTPYRRYRPRSALAPQPTGCTNCTCRCRSSSRTRAEGRRGSSIADRVS